MTIRVGMIGYGYWGPNLLRNFMANNAFQVVALADLKEESRAKAARANPSMKIVDDASVILKDPEIDAVVIVTPVATHFPLAKQALENGKHVFVEKPMCAKEEEAEELVALSKKVDRVLMVDHTFLFTGAVQTIKSIVDSGKLGRICYFDSLRVNLGLFQQDVNCLWDLAPHDLSIIDYLIDDEVVAIDVAGYCHVNPGVPDMAYLTLHYANDVVAHLNMSWMSPVKVRRFMIGATRQMMLWNDLDQDQKIRIYDTGIDFQPEGMRNMIIPAYRIGDIYSPRLPNREALGGVVEHFAKVIKGAEEPLMDGAKGLKVVRVMSRAQKLLEKNLAEIEQLRKVAR